MPERALRISDRRASRPRVPGRRPRLAGALASVAIVAVWVVGQDRIAGVVLPMQAAAIQILDPLVVVSHVEVQHRPTGTFVSVRASLAARLRGAPLKAARIYDVRVFVPAARALLGPGCALGVVLLLPWRSSGDALRRLGLVLPVSALLFVIDVPLVAIALAWEVVRESIDAQAGLVAALGRIWLGGGGMVAGLLGGAWAVTAGHRGGAGGQRA